MADLTLDDIARLRALEAKATRGPWVTDRCVVWPEPMPRLKRHRHRKVLSIMGDGNDETNAALIAEVRNALPALLAAAERGLRERLFAIVYSNYSPEEVHSLWRERAGAEAKCAQLNSKGDGGWHVIEWAVEPGTPATAIERGARLDAAGEK